MGRKKKNKTEPVVSALLAAPGGVQSRQALQVHAVRGALCGHHALQHVEGRLVCLVGETRGQRALQHGDAASVRGHLSVRGGQGHRPATAVARGAIAGASALLSSLEASSAVTLSSRDWMGAALLPEAAVFTARSVTCA